MTGALWFLITRSTRNRFGRQLARIRRPRYAIAMLLGLAYVWFTFAQPFGRPNRQALPNGVSVPVGLNAGASHFIGVSLTIAVILWWLRGGVTRALAFQPAEAQFLFPAPLSRRVLLAYKIVRSQLLLLVNAVIWMLLVRRWGVSLSAPERFASAWAFFSFTSLHRLGAALVQTDPLSRGRRIVLYGAKLAAVTAAAALVVVALPVLLRAKQLGLAGVARQLAHALAVPPASYALAPAHLIMGPMSAASPAAWRPAFAIAVAVIVLHVMWVLSMNVEFEEIAVSATTDLARRLTALRSRRVGGVALVRPLKVKRTTRIPLAPTGPPFVAIVWKNTLALFRSEGVRSLMLVVGIVALVPVLLRFMPSGSDDPFDAGMIALTPGIFLVTMTFIVGPRLFRNDLRQDLLSLSVLKSYPLRGLHIVAAELVSPALGLTVIHLGAIVVALLTAAPAFRAEIGLTRVFAATLVAPLCFGALNVANLAIQNGAALLYPAWVRLGPDSGGVEAIGQNLLFTLAAMVVLLLSLLIPLVLGGLSYALFHPSLGDWALAAGGFVGALALLAEVAWMVVRLGRVFEKTEPGAVG